MRDSWGVSCADRDDRSGLLSGRYFGAGPARLPDLRSHRLDVLATFLGLDETGAHRAVADSQRVKEIWLRLGGAAEPDQGLVSYPMSERRESSRCRGGGTS